MSKARPKTSAIATVPVVLLIVLQSGAASAGAPGGFSDKELASIKGLFGRYDVVALSETEVDGSPKAMTVAVRIKAPHEKVFEAFENPENFHYISTLFKENRVLQRHESSTAYSWASRHKLFSFVGKNTITLYPYRRIDVSVVDSTLGSGKFRFAIHPNGEKSTILVLAGILDVNSSEWLIRYLVGGNPAMREAMNMAIGIVVAKGVKAMAERLHRGKPLAKHRTKGRAGGGVEPLSKEEMQALMPLIDRGTAVLTRSASGGRMRQATAVQSVKAPAARYIEAVGTPELYPRMIKAISGIEIHDRSDYATDFSWTIGFSVFGLVSRNRMTFSPEEGIAIKGLNGDLEGATWRWQLEPNGPDRSVVAYHGYADIARSAYILEQTVKREPYLEHGLMAGSNMVMLQAISRAVKSR